MTKIVRTFEVAGPPENVFGLLSDPEKWPRWAPFVRQASRIGPKTHWIYDMGGMKVEADTEVTESSENRVYAFHQTGGFLASGTTRFDIEPTQQGSKVTWTAEYELPYSYLGKLVDKLRGRKQFEEAIDESIKGLKSRVER